MLTPVCNDKKNLLLGHCTFGILFFLSIIFYQERMVFTDMAFHSFSISSQSDFAIQNYRFGAFLTQWIPLLAVKLGISLKGLLIIYSANFIVYYYILFILCLKWLRQPILAILLLLHSILMTTDTFYWIQSELQQGIPFLIFWFALFFQHKKFSAYTLPVKIIFIGATILLPLFHPLLPVVFCFCVIAFHLMQFNLFTKKMLFAFAIVALVVISRYTFLPNNHYDETAFAKLQNIIRLFPDFFTLKSHQNFLRWCFFDYNFFILFFVWSIFILYRSGNYRLLAWQFFSCTGYLLLIHICYPEEVPQFYMENLYLPLSIMVLVPLVNHIVPFWKSKWNIWIIPFFAIRLFFIGFNHTKYSNRIQWEKEFLQKTAALPNKKIIVPESLIPVKTTIMNWGLVYEFWLLSSLEQKNTSRSILVVENPDDYIWALPGKHEFLTVWGNFAYKDLPRQYFHFSDSSAYVILRKL